MAKAIITTMKLDYYYGPELSGFHFYRIPKAILDDPRYRVISFEARMLYSVMLDRVDLSMRCGKTDLYGRVYIFFTLEYAMNVTGYGHSKTGRLFSELERIGLIERKRQGQGRPDRIYVKNFRYEQCDKNSADTPRMNPASTRIPVSSGASATRKTPKTDMDTPPMFGGEKPAVDPFSASFFPDNDMDGLDEPSMFDGEKPAVDSFSASFFPDNDMDGLDEPSMFDEEKPFVDPILALLSSDNNVDALNEPSMFDGEKPAVDPFSASFFPESDMDGLDEPSMFDEEKPFVDPLTAPLFPNDNMDTPDMSDTPRTPPVSSARNMNPKAETEPFSMRQEAEPFSIEWKPSQPEREADASGAFHDTRMSGFSDSRMSDSTPENRDFLYPLSDENEKSGLPKIESLDRSKRSAIKTDKNNTDFFEINPIPLSPRKLRIRARDRKAWRDRQQELKEYREVVEESVDYDTLLHNYPHDASLIDDLVDLITEGLCCPDAYFRIGRNSYPRSEIKERFYELDNSHLSYVIDCLNETHTRIRNIRAYLLTALYNAPKTIDAYYRFRVQHDFR